MHITEKILREAIETVRSIMAFDTGSYTDHQIMGMYGPVIASLVQSNTAFLIQDRETRRRKA